MYPFLATEFFVLNNFNKHVEFTLNYYKSVFFYEKNVRRTFLDFTDSASSFNRNPMQKLDPAMIKMIPVRTNHLLQPARPDICVCLINDLRATLWDITFALCVRNGFSATCVPLRWAYTLLNKIYKVYTFLLHRCSTPLGSQYFRSSRQRILSMALTRVSRERAK